CAAPVFPAARACQRRALRACHHRQGIFVGRRRDPQAAGAGMAVDAAFPATGLQPRRVGAPSRRRGSALYPPQEDGMTPLGLKLRELRRRKGVSQKEMAAALGVSAAYLSALEHGRRGVPTWALLQKIIGYFNIIWDDADEVQR